MQAAGASIGETGPFRVPLLCESDTDSMPGAGIVPCAYRKSNPGVLVVQSAQNRATEDASNWLGGA